MPSLRDFTSILGIEVRLLFLKSFYLVYFLCLKIRFHCIFPNIMFILTLSMRRLTEHFLNVFLKKLSQIFNTPPVGFGYEKKSCFDIFGLWQQLVEKFGCEPEYCVYLLELLE